MPLLLVFFLLLITPAPAEEHDHSAMGDVGKFYETWRRPKGHFSGIGHRTQSCCNKTDCFAVAETKMANGRYTVRPEGSPFWFPVDPSVVESNQIDPRESPDSRSHVCIIANTVVCFQEGGGM